MAVSRVGQIRGAKVSRSEIDDKMACRHVDRGADNLSQLKITIAGAGVLGVWQALTLARQGLDQHGNAEGG